MNLRHLSLAALTVAVVVVVGCGTPVKTEGPVNHTLNGNSRFPSALIRDHFEVSSWSLLGDSPYHAYLMLRGRVESNGSLSALRLVESYPDTNPSREEWAQEFFQQIRLSGSPVGTQIRPPAEVYVVFYEPPGEGNMALVFARFAGTAFTGGSTRRDEGNTWIQLFSY
jgi:hypothetical protein